MNAADCRVRGCDGRMHLWDTCDVVLADMATTGVDLIAEVDSVEGGPVELVVWEGDGRDLLRTSDPAAGHAFADRLRALAAAVDKGAGLLATPSVGVAKPDLSVDHAARFAALDEYRLFALEGDTEDCTAASEYLKSLLIVLADWRPRIVALLADAPAWSIPEVGAYEAAVARTLESWTLYSFRYDGGPDLPETFSVPEQAADNFPGSQEVSVARIVSAGRRDLVVRGVAA